MARPTVDRVIAMTHTDALLAEIAGLQRQVADLQQQVMQLTTVEPNSSEDRFGVALNTMSTAPVTGYLSVSSTDGRTGRVELLVGYEDPPTERVGAAHSGGSSAYLGAVIREGEVSCWTPAANSPRSIASSHHSSDESCCVTDGRAQSDRSA
jgi:hypothetical protein